MGDLTLSGVLARPKFIINPPSEATHEHPRGTLHFLRTGSYTLQEYTVYLVDTVHVSPCRTHHQHPQVSPLAVDPRTVTLAVLEVIIEKKGCRAPHLKIVILNSMVSSYGALTNMMFSHLSFFRKTELIPKEIIS